MPRGRSPKLPTPVSRVNPPVGLLNAVSVLAAPVYIPSAAGPRRFTAALFLAIAIYMDLLVVAPFFDTSFAMFASAIGVEIDLPAAEAVPQPAAAEEILRELKILQRTRANRSTARMAVTVSGVRTPGFTSHQ